MCSDDSEKGMVFDGRDARPTHLFHVFDGRDARPTNAVVSVFGVHRVLRALCVHPFFSSLRSLRSRCDFALRTINTPVQRASRRY